MLSGIAEPIGQHFLIRFKPTDSEIVKAKVPDYVWDYVDNDFFSDPGGTDGIIKKMHVRDVFTKKYSWALPSREAIEILVEKSPCIEIGARNGFWAAMVIDAGGDILCYDIKPARKQYHLVEEGSYEKVINNRTLFLCWPPYADPMAFNCLNLYEGASVVYVGEGSGGCTGDDYFHELLQLKWTLDEIIDIPQFWGIHDAMFIYSRRNQNG